MSVNYTRINWEDTPSTQTPINAENLNAMDSAIDDLASAVNGMDGVTEDVEDLQTEIGALKNDLSEFPNGTYPNMTVGNADQLTATVGIEDTAPYLFRTSGGSNDIGDREEVRKIVGGTIVNNQLLPELKNNNGWAQYNYHTTYTWGNNEVTIIASTEGANGDIQYSDFRTIEGHKYFLRVPFCNASDTVPVYVRVGTSQNYPVNMVGTKDTYVTAERVFVADASARLLFQGNNGTKFKELNLTDLTQDFGTAIADYVYSLETATAGAGVAWLKKHFPKQFDSGYQPYDAGSMQSVSGLTAHKMVGFNQWDEEVELGGINENTGAGWSTNDRIRSKNFIPVLPNTAYYLKAPTSIGTLAFYDADKNFISALTSISANYTRTTPSNAWYMKFNMPSGYGTTYNHDININFHWDGEKDGTYEPYKTWSYALDDSVTLRGIPKVDANGNLYYDGDEYLPDGTVNRRYGVVDLGTLNWSKYAETTNIPVFYASSDIPGLKPGSGGNAVCDRYVCRAWSSLGSRIDKCVEIHPTIPRPYVSDSSYTDAESFKSAMSGVMLIYELAEPTTETAEPYQQTQICDDFGTEEFVLADGAFPVPVGHDTMYQNNLRAKLEMSPESPDGDCLYVVQQESGENTYVPLASTATIQDILTRLTALENA